MYVVFREGGLSRFDKVHHAKKNRRKRKIKELGSATERLHPDSAKGFGSSESWIGLGGG
jgi:hypothetical protein